MTREEEEKPKRSVWYYRYADIIAMALLSLAVLIPAYLGDGRDQPPVLEVVELDASFYKTVLHPEKIDWDLRGPNGVGVSWAVFFHKPYCGACRRIRPMFHALARTTNSTSTLRFASLDCVKHRSFCKREKVDREPLIRLYQANPRAAATAVPEDAAAQAGKPNTQPKKKKKRAAFERSSVAEWRGLLVAYEVLDWFKGLQHAGGPLAGRPQVAWGGDDALAEAMAAFKASDARHTGSPADPVALPPNAHADGHKPQDHDPNGYLVDLNSVLALALRDDIFPIDGDSDGSDSEGGGAKLVGERLTTLIHFVEVLSFTHPTKAARSALATLRDELSGRPEWRPVAYEHLLATTLGGAMGRGAGYPEPPPTGHDVSLADGPATAVGPSPHWRWCRSNEAGVGGYPCGLWILFHTMLANSDGRRAHLTLGIVHAFVGRFYGCVECAVNFEAEWEHEGGADQTGHVPTSLWLWRVHNMVRARLTEEDDTLASPKTQWPSPAHCPACFSNATQQRWGLLPPPPPPEAAPAAATTTAVPAQGSAAWERQARTAGSSLLEWEDALWSPEYVFSFLQETFCAASDTFVCQGFLDGRRA